MIKTKLYLCLFWGMLGISIAAQSQDPQFSQYQSAPLYLNPGFTGTTEHHRFSFNHRTQWANLPKAFATFGFGYDYNMKNSNSNFGFLAMTQQMGSAGLRNTTAALSYAYTIPISESVRMATGIMGGFGMRSINRDKLVFGDQLEFGNPDAASVDPSAYKIGNSSYFDFNAGFLIYNKDFWTGFAVNHINQPNHSMMDQISPLPMKASVHAGVRIPMDLGYRKSDIDADISPSFNYKMQGEFDQLDVGMNVFYDMVMAGVWYKGIPIQRNVSGKLSRDALAFLFGIKLNNLNFGYSYDLTISRLTPAGSGGSHEFSLSYHFNRQKNPNKVDRKDKFVPCPAFLK